MRTFPSAALACFALASVIGGWLLAAAAAQKPAAVPAANSPSDSGAPARHARRTACLKDAKARKLVGAQRSSYVKNCMGRS